MPIIYSYPNVTAETGDLVILSDASSSGKPTKTTTANSIVTLTKDVLDLNQFKLDGKPFVSTTPEDGDTINFDGTSWSAGPTAANVVSVVSVTATTSGGNYVATVPGIIALSREVVYKVVFDSTNTISPVTLNINGYGAYALQRGTETGFEDIPISFLLAGPDVFVTWDGDRFQVYINNGTSTNPRSISDVEFVNDAPVTAAHGGITKGQTFGRKSTGRGYTMQEMFDMILYPYQSPALSSLAITGQGPTVEVGYTLPSNPTALTFTWNKSNPGNILANSGVLTDVTNATTLVSSIDLAGTGSTTYIYAAGINYNAPASHQWKLSGINTQKGSIPTSSYTITWKWKWFWGTNASATIAAGDIAGLGSSALASSSSGSGSWGASNYKYLVMPSSFPEPSVIKDSATNLGIGMAGVAEGYNLGSGTYKYLTITSGVPNTHGVSTTYRVYRTKNKLGGSVSFNIS